MSGRVHHRPDRAMQTASDVFDAYEDVFLREDAVVVADGLGVPWPDGAAEVLGTVQNRGLHSVKGHSDLHLAFASSMMFSVENRQGVARCRTKGG